MTLTHHMRKMFGFVFIKILLSLETTVCLNPGWDKYILNLSHILQVYNKPELMVYMNILSRNTGVHIQHANNIHTYKYTNLGTQLLPPFTRTWTILPGN